MAYDSRHVAVVIWSRCAVEALLGIWARAILGILDMPLSGPFRRRRRGALIKRARAFGLDRASNAFGRLFSTFVVEYRGLVFVRSFPANSLTSLAPADDRREAGLFFSPPKSFFSARVQKESRHPRHREPERQSEVRGLCGYSNACDVDPSAPRFSSARVPDRHRGYVCISAAGPGQCSQQQVATMLAIFLAQEVPETSGRRVSMKAHRNRSENCRLGSVTPDGISACYLGL